MMRPTLARAFGIVALAGFVVMIGASGAYAHGDITPGENLWLAWDHDFWIVVPLLLAAGIYLAGIRGQRDARAPAMLGRHGAFLGGLLAFYVALQSPIEPISDHVFIVHQVEHMLLRTIGPLLVMVAMPQAALLRGLPGWARRGIVAPVASSTVMQGVFGFLAHPAIATALFIGTTYFWMIPRYHDIAILDLPIHYTWHVTLMLSGLLFFWRVFDPRPLPLGISYRVRLFMVWIAMMGNIFLGFYLSFKHTELYSAYDRLGRLGHLDPLTDEEFGGLTMWIPGCMMLAVAALVVVHRWLSAEDRSGIPGRSGPAAAPVNAVAFARSQRPKNTALALGLLTFAGLVLAITISVAVVVHELDVPKVHAIATAPPIKPSRLLPSPHG